MPSSPVSISLALLLTLTAGIMGTTPSTYSALLRSSPHGLDTRALGKEALIPGSTVHLRFIQRSNHRGDHEDFFCLLWHWVSRAVPAAGCYWGESSNHQTAHGRHPPVFTPLPSCSCYTLFPIFLSLASHRLVPIQIQPFLMWRRIPRLDLMPSHRHCIVFLNSILPIRTLNLPQFLAQSQSSIPDRFLWNYRYRKYPH